MTTSQSRKPKHSTAQISVATMRHIVQLAGSDFEAFFETVAIESAKLVGADGAALIVQGVDGEMHYKFFYGLPQSYQQYVFDYRSQMGSGTIGQALTQRKAIFTADYVASPHAVKTIC